MSEQKVKDFTTFLGEELKRQEITIPEFAKRMGVTKQIVYKWLDGTYIMTLKNYYKALEVLGIDESYVKTKGEAE